MAAFGRGCVKTQNRPLEIVSTLGEFLVEVSCLLVGRCRLVSQSIASHVVFEDDFWGEIVGEFSHSLGQKRPIRSSKIRKFEGLLSANSSRSRRRAWLMPRRNHLVHEH